MVKAALSGGGGQSHGAPISADVWADIDAQMRHAAAPPQNYFSAEQKARDWNISAGHAKSKLLALFRAGKLAREKVGKEYFYGPPA